MEGSGERRSKLYAVVAIFLIIVTSAILIDLAMPVKDNLGSVGYNGSVGPFNGSQFSLVALVYGINTSQANLLSGEVTSNVSSFSVLLFTRVQLSSWGDESNGKLPPNGANNFVTTFDTDFAPQNWTQRVNGTGELNKSWKLMPNTVYDIAYLTSTSNITVFPFESGLSLYRVYSQL